MRNPKSTWATPEMIAEILRMAKEGIGYKEIGEKLGISRTRASSLAVKHGHRRYHNRLWWFERNPYKS